MFSNMKPAFGTPTPGTSYGIGASTSTGTNPWGNSNNPQMFGKPGSTGFGQQTPSFGQPSTSSNSIFPFFPQNNPSGFGTTTTNQSTFGSNMFGQQPQQQTASNALFGSNNFGQQKTGFGFSTQNQQPPNLFGQPTQPQNLLFQPSGSSNLFGNTNTFSSGTVGTTVKFSPVNGTDTMQKNNSAISINTKHHCITCMKEYEGKSLEELRFEDYQANRKGPQSQFGTTPFGNSSSMFGQTTENKTGFGQPTVAFNNVTGTAFGQQNQTFGMGNQQSTANTIFGKPPAFGTTGSTSTGFGAFNTPSNATNSFGTNATKPFGATAPLFGSTQAQQQTAPFGNNLFGQNNQSATSSFFNKPAQTTGFGSGSFGFTQTPATTTSNLFQPPKPVFGLGQPASTGAFGPTSFGQTNPPTAFGASTFGKQLTFGQNTSSFPIGGQTNLFSNNQQKPGSLLGSGGLFGTSNFGTTTSSFGVSQPNVQPQAQGFSLDVLQESKNMNVVVGNQFGHSSFLAGLLPVDKSLSPTLCTTNPAEIKQMLENSKKVDENNSNNKTKLKLRPPKPQRDNLFEETNDEEINKLYKMSCKRLTIKNDDEYTKESIFEVKSIYNDISAGNDTLSQSLSFHDKGPSPDESAENANVISVNKQFARHNLEDLINQEYSAINKEFSLSGSPKSSQVMMFKEKATSNTSVETPKNPIHKPTAIDDLSSISNKSLLKEMSPQKSNDNGDSSIKQSGSVAEVTEHEEDTRRIAKCGIILNRSEYYTLPPINELDKMIGEDGRCIVKGFTVGRRKYGNVYFPDELNVRNLNLDEIVHFRYKEINMYPDETKKPPVGEGLNRRAQVTLDRVYPRVKETKEIIEDVEQILVTRFPEQLVEISGKHGLKFIDYRPETGSWVFMVEHFSKYGFTESDEEDCEFSVLNRNAQMRKGLTNGIAFHGTILPEARNGFQVGENTSFYYENGDDLSAEALSANEQYTSQGSFTSDDELTPKEYCLTSLKYSINDSPIVKYSNMQTPGERQINGFPSSGMKYDKHSHLSRVYGRLASGGTLDISKPDHIDIVNKRNTQLSSMDIINIENHTSIDLVRGTDINDLIPDNDFLTRTKAEKSISATDLLKPEHDSSFEDACPDKQFLFEYNNSEEKFSAVCQESPVVNNYSSMNGETHYNSFNHVSPDSNTSKHVTPNLSKFADSEVTSEYTDEDDLRQCDILHRSIELDMEETFKPFYTPLDENLFYHDTRIQTMKAAFFNDSEITSSASSVEDYEIRKNDMVMLDQTYHESSDESTLSDYGNDINFNIEDLTPDRCYTDMSIFNRKVGGVAWVQGFRYYNIELEDENLHYNLSVRTLPLEQCSDNFKERIEQCIKLAQVWSDCSLPQGEGLPTLQIKEDKSYLKACYDVFNKAPKFQDTSVFLYKDVWSLCYALWGFDKGPDPFVKSRLSAWLKTSLNNQLRIGGNFPGGDIEESLEIIYKHLTCFNIEEAATVAMEANMPVLSMLISQVNLSQKSKELIKHQLVDWCTSNYGDHMYPTMSKIYLLLSGQPYYWGMDICENLDWKRAFGVHLWYLTSGGAPIQVAIDAYRRGFEEDGYAAKPKPFYCTEEEESSTYDIRYQLLQLYKNKTHRLCKALNPETYSNSATDYQLSWLLLLFFRSVKIGLIDNSEENIIHTNFSNQLENLGLWELAFVPLLYLKDNHLKKNLVCNILYRNLPIQHDEGPGELDTKLTTDYHIPLAWIAEIREQKKSVLSHLPHVLLPVADDQNDIANV